VEFTTLKIAGVDAVRVLNEHRSRFRATGQYPFLIGDAEDLGHLTEVAEFNIYSELDEERWETRKIEIFADGRIGFASASESTPSTRFRPAAFPDNARPAARGESPTRKSGDPWLIVYERSARDRVPALDRSLPRWH
jgi:hypothetical protein